MLYAFIKRECVLDVKKDKMCPRCGTMWLKLHLTCLSLAQRAKTTSSMPSRLICIIFTLKEILLGEANERYYDMIELCTFSRLKVIRFLTM